MIEQMLENLVDERSVEPLFDRQPLAKQDGCSATENLIPLLLDLDLLDERGFQKMTKIKFRIAVKDRCSQANRSVDRILEVDIGILHIYSS